MCDAGDAGILRVAEDRGAQFDGPALALEFADADEGMLFLRWMALVVVVLKQAGGGVELDEAGALFPREAEAVSFCLTTGGHTDFYSDGVFAQAFTLGPLGEQLPGLFAAEFLCADSGLSHPSILRVAHDGSRFFGVSGV